MAIRGPDLPPIGKFGVEYSENNVDSKFPNFSELDATTQRLHFHRLREHTPRLFVGLSAPNTVALI